jgi:hypothetical protein
MARIKRPLAAFAVSAALLAGLAAVALFLLARSAAFGQDALGVPCESLAPESPGSCSGEPLDWRREAPMRVVALLPTGRQGRPYRSPIIRGGLKGYVYDIQSSLPPGLMVTSTGYLEGTPTQASTFHLRVFAHDSSTPPRHISAEWWIRILPPLTRRVPPPPPPPVQETSQTSAQPQQPEQPAPGQMTVYVLDKAALAAVDQDFPFVPLPPPPTAKQPARAKAAAAAGTSSAAGPTSAPPSGAVANPPARPSSLLSRLQDTEYPDRSVFASAVRDALASSPASPRPELEPLVEDAVNKAARRYEYTNAWPLRWSSRPGCKCVAPLPQDLNRTIYGFFPFWRVDAAPIDFNLFDRVGFLGLQGKENGAWLEPVKRGDRLRQARLSDFAWAAKAHGVKLDLVLQRANWQDLSQNQAKNYSDAVAAADSAVEWLKIPLDISVFRRALLPFWRSPTFVFDGLTIMFAEPAYTDPTDKISYETYYENFVSEAIKQANKLGRQVNINLVMTDSVFCTTPVKGMAGKNDPCRAGQFSQFYLDWYLRLARSSKSSKVSVRYIVLMHAPTQDTKKAMVAAINGLDQIGNPNLTRGADRILLLHRIIPVSFTPPPSPSGPMLSERLQDDFDFYHDNFNGVGLWQVPTPKSANQYITWKLITNLYSPTAIEKLFSLDKIPWFCSTAARLSWEASILAILIALGLMAFADLSDAQFILVRNATWVIAVLGPLLLGLVLLQRDPTLDELSRDNGILFFALIVFFAVTFVLWRRPKVRDP